MADDKYYTTDTKSVASEIDVSEVKTAANAENDEAWRLDWKRPLGHLLLILLVLLTVVITGIWFGIELPVVP